MTLRGPNKNYHPVAKVLRRLPISDEAFLSQKNVPTSNMIWSMKLGVYDRLFRHHTFNSIRKNYSLNGREIIPNDSLDFALSSIYIHSEDYNVPKSYISMQPETLNIQTRNLTKNVSSGLSRRDDVGGKKKKAMGLSDEKVDEPKIVIAASLMPINKSKMDKFADSFLTAGGKNENISEHTVSSKNISYKQHDRSITRKKYSKSSLNKTLPLTCGPKYSRKHVKTGAPIRQYDEFLLTKGDGTIARDENLIDTASMRRRGEIDFAENLESSMPDVKSAVMMMAREHDVAQAGMGNDVFDKAQRRETYAAQMRAIERIHPSSLRLAVDGPHSDQTNPGYSRKIDGTFYGV